MTFLLGKDQYYKWPLIPKIGIVILIIFLLGRVVLYFYKTKSKKSDYNPDFLPYGQMWMLEEIPEYRFKKKFFFVMKKLALVSFCSMLVFLSIAAGRPSTIQVKKIGRQKRDLFLCLDVSYSLYKQNYDLVDHLEKLVNGLEGDRLGISMFNTSSMLFMPMTDDRTYTIEKLEELKSYFKMQGEYMELQDIIDDNPSLHTDEVSKSEDLLMTLRLFDKGTLHDNISKGSSLIGDGLGTCLYNFPSITDSERTRIIIMSTDNQLNAFSSDSQVINLSDASLLCRDSRVTVFGIFPSDEFFYKKDNQNYDSCKNGFEEAVENTGGAFYTFSGDSFNSGDILKEIQKHPAMKVNDITIKREIDLPNYALMGVFISLVIFAACKFAIRE